MIKLSEILKKYKNNAEVSFCNADCECGITGITSNSKNIQPGNIFVCLKGAKRDGHDYASEAIEAGACAVVAEHKLDDSIPQIVTDNTRKALPLLLSAFYGEPEKSFKHMIGLTGTNGKTSTSYMLKKIFDEAGYKTGLIGTTKYLIGNEEYKCDETKAFLTTPDPELLFTLFDEMRKAGTEILIMEVSSHSLQLDKLGPVTFDSAIFTNLTRDHLDFHKNFTAYREAKTKLFNISAKGFFNKDDPASAEMMRNSSCSKFTYGIDGNEADFIAKNVTYKGADGIKYEFLSENLIFRITLPIPGRFSVYNSLAAASCAIEFGIDPAVVVKALENMEHVQGRIEKVPTDTDFSVFIDFAHTPDALENVLKTVKGFAEGRVITLFGCGGDRDKTKRPIMAKIASELSDYVIITSDNSRTEEKEAIIADILEGIKGSKTPYISITDRTEAIKYAMDNALPKDTIILAGKGHEEYEIDKTGKHPYSEKNIVMEYSAKFTKEKGTGNA